MADQGALRFAALPSGTLPAVLTGAAGAAALPAALLGMADARVVVTALAAYLLVAVLMLRGLIRHYPHAVLGACNIVTLLRALAVAALTGMLWQSTGGWSGLTLAMVALVLDGVDGWLARRHGLASAFGARFDMETDAAMALVLALHVWLAGIAGPAILLLGTMRYAFVAAFAVAPWLAAPLPDRFGRKVACVVQIAALIALLIPGLPAGVAAGIAWPATAALAWSFGRDILWLWRNRI